MATAPEDAVVLGFALFQMGVALALLRPSEDHLWPRVLLAALFIVNSVIAVVLWIAPVIVVDEPARAAVQQLVESVDAASTWLLIGLIGAVSGRFAPRRSAVVAGVAALAAVVVTWGPNLLGITVLGPGEWGGAYGWWIDVRDNVRQWHTALFHLAVGPLVVLLARGPRWARWVSLAFLPRIMYWGVLSLDQVGPPPYSNVEGPLLLWSPVLAMVFGVWAAARLLRRSTPSPGLVLAFGFLGHALALLHLAGTALPGLGGGMATLLLNLTSLALVRPALTLHALAPQRLAPTVTGTVLALSGGFGAMAAATILLGVQDDGTTRLVGLALGLIVLGGFDAARRADSLDGPTVGPTPTPGDILLDRYRVDGVLGEGGTGVVYAARDLDARRDVVLKLLRPGLGTGDLVEREREAMRRVEHPNVVAFLGTEATAFGTMLVMERVHGRPLNELIDARGPPGTMFENVANDTLSGLQAVHDAGLVHRDVKPQNILVDDEGRAKLTDLNVARVPNLDATLTLDSEDRSPVGTIRYMAPEVARGQPATVASDLYSAGATLYELWRGEPLVKLEPNEGHAQLRARVAAGVPLPLTDGVHPTLAAWFQRALAQDPARRFSTAAEMRETLDPALKEAAGNEGGIRR